LVTPDFETCNRAFFEADDQDDLISFDPPNESDFLPSAFKAQKSSIKEALAQRRVVPNNNNPNASDTENNNNVSLDQSTSDFSTAIGPVLENFNDLDENGQNQLLIGAFASKDIALIQQISKLKRNANELALLPRLVKNLVADAKKLEITNLKYDQDPGKRRYYFNVWLEKIKDVLQMYKQTQGIIIGTKIILSDNPTSAGNQAVYHFVASKVDSYYRTKISQESHGLGAESLLLLQKFCAHVSPQDKIHFHQKFLELRILPNETATSFLRRFTIARNNAEKVDCIYSDSELIDAFLSALHPSTNHAYQLQTTLFKSKREHKEDFSFSDIERQLLAIDESNSRETSKSRVQFKQSACVAVANANNNQTRSDKFKTTNKYKRRDKQQARSAKATDKSKVKCYNCNKYGHYSKE